MLQNDVTQKQPDGRHAEGKECGKGAELTCSSWVRLPLSLAPPHSPAWRLSKPRIFVETSLYICDWLNHWPWWLNSISNLYPLQRGGDGWGWKFQPSKQEVGSLGNQLPSSGAFQKLHININLGVVVWGGHSFHRCGPGAISGIHDKRLNIKRCSHCSYSP